MYPGNGRRTFVRQEISTDWPILAQRLSVVAFGRKEHTFFSEFITSKSFPQLGISAVRSSYLVFPFPLFFVIHSNTGKNCCQQYVHYPNKAMLITHTHTIAIPETLVYTNNSPETLHAVYFVQASS
jgi:hypothetical protein